MSNNVRLKPLTKALFLEKLSIFGADFTRWDEVNPDEAAEFLSNNASVADDYEQAKLLDNALARYRVAGAFDTDMMIDRLRTKLSEDKISDFSVAQARQKKYRQGQIHYWGGGIAAVAASLLLFMVVAGNTPHNTAYDIMGVPASQDQVQAGAVLADNSSSAVTDIALVQDEEDQFFDSWERVLTEDLAQREMIALLQMASLSVSFQEDDSINAVAIEEAARDMDLWDLYIASGG